MIKIQDKLKELADNFRLLACLKRVGWLAMIAGMVFLFSNQDIVTYSQVNLTLQTAKPELIQVFCDQGYGFKEELSNSVKNINSATEYKQISLKLPDSCKRLRLDLGDTGAVIKIISASLITSGGNQLDILSEIKFPASLNGIKASNSNPAKFIATTNDPFLVLSGDYSIPTAKGYSGVGLLKILGMFLITIGSVASISYVLRSLNYEQTILIAHSSCRAGGRGRCFGDLAGCRRGIRCHAQDATQDR